MPDQSAKKVPREGVADVVDVARGADEQETGVGGEGERGDARAAGRKGKGCEIVVSDLELGERSLKGARIRERERSVARWLRRGTEGRTDPVELVGVEEMDRVGLVVGDGEADARTIPGSDRVDV